MALPESGFSLQDVKNEIVNNGGSVVEPFSLSQAIEIAGKSGIWNKLSDFAGWSYAYLEVSPTSLTFAWDDLSPQTIDVFTNQSWTASASDTWININSSSGTGDGAIAVSVENNLTGSTRYGSVVIQTTNGLSRTVSIIQNG